MIFNRYKKVSVTVLLVLFIFLLQGVAQQKKDDDKAENLKVLSKKISADDLHLIMRQYAKSLGVKCGHCHAQRKDGSGKLDFVSDEKPEKTTARKMIRMTADINRKYITKIGDNKFEQIFCVTCHMGHLKPTISVDSLAKN